jgi:hypothetical protein
VSIRYFYFSIQKDIFPRIMLRIAQQSALFLLLNAGDPESQKFIKACEELDPETVISSRDHRPGFFGCTLLHIASRYGLQRAAIYLIGLGHDIDVIDSSVSGATPLMEAVVAGQLEMVALLQNSGASITFLDFRGENVFHHAARKGFTVCKTLLGYRDISMSDVHQALRTRNTKKMLPEQLEVNPSIADLLKQYRETGQYIRPQRKMINRAVTPSGKVSPTRAASPTNSPKKH